MPKFFVPAAKDDEQAEQVYEAIRKFNSAPAEGPRIYALSWYHNGKPMTCEVGEPLPGYYGTDDEPVLAIFDCGNYYLICTPNRGGLCGGPVFAGKGERSTATLFSDG